MIIFRIMYSPANCRTRAVAAAAIGACRNISLVKGERITNGQAVFLYIRPRCQKTKKLVGAPAVRLVATSVRMVLTKGF